MSGRYAKDAYSQGAMRARVTAVSRQTIRVAERNDTVNSTSSGRALSVLNFDRLRCRSTSADAPNGRGKLMVLEGKKCFKKIHANLPTVRQFIY